MKGVAKAQTYGNATEHLGKAIGGQASKNGTRTRLLDPVEEHSRVSVLERDNAEHRWLVVLEDLPCNVSSIAVFPYRDSASRQQSLTAVWVEPYQAFLSDITLP